MFRFLEKFKRKPEPKTTSIRAVRIEGDAYEGGEYDLLFERSDGSRSLGARVRSSPREILLEQFNAEIERGTHY